MTGKKTSEAAETLASKHGPAGTMLVSESRAASLTVAQWHESRLKADTHRRESEKQSRVVSALEKFLDPAGEMFPFQCTCGVTHQFSYSETPEGLRRLMAK